MALQNLGIFCLRAIDSAAGIGLDGDLYSVVNAQPRSADSTSRKI